MSADTPTRMPAWLRDTLVRDGHMTPSGITRAARPRACSSCGALVMAGLDGDLAAGPAIVQCCEIDRVGEVIALAQGRKTYNLTLTYDSKKKARWELNPREYWHIESDREWTIMVQHVCGNPIPPADAADPIKRAVAAARDGLGAVDYDGPPTF